MAKNKKAIIILAMIVIIGTVLSPFVFAGIIPDGKDRLETSECISQILMSVFAIFGVIVALWQYIIYSRREIELKDKEIYDMDKARIQKAIDLAAYFKDNVLDMFIPINHILTKTNVSEILKKVPYDKVSKFDVHEMNQYISSAEIDKINNMKRTREFRDILTQISLVDDRWKDCIREIDYIEDGKPITKVTVKESSILFKYQQLLEATLNNLEYFSMHFVHETADESVVYQSLHNAFIEIVMKLYYNICKNNNGSCEQKYYTNIISLYKLWRDEAIKQRESETVSAEEIIRTGKKLRKS